MLQWPSVMQSGNRTAMASQAYDGDVRVGLIHKPIIGLPGSASARNVAVDLYRPVMQCYECLPVAVGYICATCAASICVVRPSRYAALAHCVLRVVACPIPACKSQNRRSCKVQWEDPGSNLTADGCVYCDGYCNMQPSARAASYAWVNLALHPFWVVKSSTGFGWGKGGNVTSCGCDPIGHVSSRMLEPQLKLEY